MESYRSLVAWQRASKFCLATLEAADNAWHPRASPLIDQLRRAAVSVDINIVEGYALNTPALFRRHLRIAIGSAAEAERLVQIASARGYVTPQTATTLEAMAQEVLRALFGLIRSPRLRRKSGK